MWKWGEGDIKRNQNQKIDVVVFITMLVGWQTCTNIQTTFTLFDSNSQSILSMVPQQFLQGVYLPRPKKVLPLLSSYWNKHLWVHSRCILMLKNNNNKKKKLTMEHSSLWSLIHRGIPTTVLVCKAIKFGPLSMQIRATKWEGQFLLGRAALTIWVWCSGAETSLNFHLA